MSAPIICPNPNCGYRGPARVQARGSGALGCLLLLLFILPGILYLVVAGGHDQFCPRCGVGLGRAPNDDSGPAVLLLILVVILGALCLTMGRKDRPAESSPRRRPRAGRRGRRAAPRPSPPPRKPH